MYGTNETATVVVSQGKGLVYRERQKVLMVFGAHAPIETGMTTVFGYRLYEGKFRGRGCPSQPSSVQIS